MANLEFNPSASNGTASKGKRVPISRNNMFYSEESFQFETEIAKTYLEQDVNQTVILYSVDIEKSTIDGVYGESEKNKLAFFPPIEIHCLYNLQQSELKAYESTSNLGTYVKPGTLTVNVMQDTLDELGVDIKVGDYIGVLVTEDNMIYYSVNDNGRINYDNAKTTFGYKPMWRKIECNYVDTTEFNGI